MKRFILLLIAVMLSAGIITADISFAEEKYRTGAIREEVWPDWVIPSPPVEYLGDLSELDEACDNSDGLPPVGNQSSQGSCTAWATAYYYLTYLQGQEYGWDLSDPEHQCSPAFTYNHINGGQDWGSHPTDAFHLFETSGCGTMADMPYDVSDCTRFPSEETFINGMPFRTISTYSFSTFNNAGIQSLKNHLLNGNIAVTAITVWSNFQNIGNFDNTYCVSEIYGDEPGGHAVTIIGFDDEMVTADGIGAFRMVNSWGTGWGDDGFWWMSYEAMMSGAINWGYALYATDRTGYEPELVVRVNLNHTDRYALNYRMGIGQPNSPIMTLDFLDFISGSRANLPFPQSALVLDITDMINFIDEDVPNDLFLRVSDTDSYDGHSGVMEQLVVEDIERQHYAISQDTPALIPDNYTGGSASVVLYYTVIPPVNLAAELNLSNGNTQLTWDPPQELDEFVQYIISRDGDEIGTTTENSYTDALPGFGIYHYSVASEWDECVSWSTEEVQVNWIEPVTPSYTVIQSIEEGTGNFVLNWEQLRDYDIIYDDGDYETPLTPTMGSPSGTMAAEMFSAPEAGKALRIGAFIVQVGNLEMHEIKLLLLRHGQNNLPGEVFYESEPFIPQGEGWTWIQLDGSLMPFDGPDDFWVALCWLNPGYSHLGLDLDLSGGEFRPKAMFTVEETWSDMDCAGNLMLRVEYGTEEYVNDWTGLTGFDVYLDGELLGNVNSDIHRFEDSLPGPGEYVFQVNAVYQQGVWPGEPFNFDWDGLGQDVEEVAGLPLTWHVGQPYPNPFNPATVFEVRLPVSAPLKVEVYNLLGRRVAVLADGTYNKGTHKLTFDASHLSSGVYLVRTEVTGKVEEIRKAILMR